MRDDVAAPEAAREDDGAERVAAGCDEGEQNAQAKRLKGIGRSPCSVAQTPENRLESTAISLLSRRRPRCQNPCRGAGLSVLSFSRLVPGASR
jgi:hypothetical protein